MLLRSRGGEVAKPNSKHDEATKGSRSDGCVGLAFFIFIVTAAVIGIVGSCLGGVRAGDPTSIALLAAAILLLIGLVAALVAVFRVPALVGWKRAILRRLLLTPADPNGAEPHAHLQPNLPGIQVENFNVYSAANVNLGEMRGQIITHIARVSGQNVVNLPQMVEEFANAVMTARTMTASDRRALLERLDFLSESASVEPPKRRSSMLKNSIATIGEMIAGVTPLVKLWSELEPMFRSHFGL
jgi:hypothetical protein